MCFVLFLTGALGCTNGGSPITAPGSRIDQQIEFIVDRGFVANHSSSGEIPSVQYLPGYQIRNKGGPVTYQLRTTLIGPSGDAYADVEGSTSPTRTLPASATVSAREVIRDFNSVRARAVRYRLRLDVTFADGSAGSMEGEGVLIDDLPPRPTGFVISQIRLIGAAGTADQFVELHNGSGEPVNLSSWTLESWHPDGETRIRIAVRFPSVLVSPGCYFLVTPSGRSGTAEGVGRDGVLLLTLPLDGGLALRAVGGQVIDQVGFNPGSAFKEGVPLAPLTELRNRSHARVTDTASNVSDFVVRDPSQPRNMSHCSS